MWSNARILIFAATLSGCSGNSDNGSRYPQESASPTSGAIATIPPTDAASNDIFDTGHEKLLNIPEIVTVTGDGINCTVTVKNCGDTNLVYYSTESGHIQLVQETFESGRWKYEGHDWCGTGKNTYTLHPNESATLFVNFWAPTKRERMLALFSESGTSRSGLVVLAAEPGGTR